MKISIALASYNGTAYIREQLNSFAQQSRLPDELVVCDDLSADETTDIIDEFARSAPFDVVVVRNTENLGYTRNFERALSLCSGDLIFLADQDDVWRPGKIEAVCTEFCENDWCMVVVHDGWLVNERMEWSGATKRGQMIAGWGSDDLLATGALTALRREFLSVALPIPEGVRGHDVWIHSLARLLKARKVMAACLQLIRRHSANTSDWIASSVEKINKRRVLLEGMRSVPAASYDDRARLSDELVSRISVISTKHPTMFPAKTIEEALSFLEGEGRAIRARNELLKLGLAQRWMHATEMLLAGHYKHFEGLKSFVRDVTR